MQGHDIVVVGASAGGVEALSTLVRTLPAQLPAAIFVVLHIPAQSPSVLADILDRVGPFKAVQAVDGAKIEYGHIYVAPPDHHMLVTHGCIRVMHGPRENRHRPAIDPLFRTAAQAYGPRVVGVVLTGSLDDGTAGLLAIKRRHGIAIVQDPKEALYASMPKSALENVVVDYTLPLAQIAPTLLRLSSEPVESIQPEPGQKEDEVEIMDMDTSLMQNGKHAGTPSAFSCPECGGVLWELQDGELLRFRCRVGHGFSVESMQAEQAEALESALWVALKTLQESEELSRRMQEQALARGQSWLAKRYEEKLKEAEKRSQLLRRVLMKDDVVSGPGDGTVSASERT